MDHAINCEISEKLSANCTCGVDMAVPVAAVPPSIDDSGPQDWASVSGATAWHLIDRHADNWEEVERMMEAWRVARTEALSGG